MSDMPLKTCWAFNGLWNNKFRYQVASCWLLVLSPHNLHTTDSFPSPNHFSISLNLSESPRRWRKQASPKHTRKLRIQHEASKQKIIIWVMHKKWKTNWCHCFNFIHISTDLYMFRAHRRVHTAVHTTTGSVFVRFRSRAPYVVAGLGDCSLHLYIWIKLK